MLVLILEVHVQKGCNGVIDTFTCRVIISVIQLFIYQNNLKTKAVQITEDALYMYHVCVIKNMSSCLTGHKLSPNLSVIPDSLIYMPSKMLVTPIHAV